MAPAVEPAQSTAPANDAVLAEGGLAPVFQAGPAAGHVDTVPSRDNGTDEGPATQQDIARP